MGNPGHCSLPSFPPQPRQCFTSSSLWFKLRRATKWGLVAHREEEHPRPFPCDPASQRNPSDGTWVLHPSQPHSCMVGRKAARMELARAVVLGQSPELNPKHGSLAVGWVGREGQGERSTQGRGLSHLPPKLPLPQEVPPSLGLFVAALVPTPMGWELLTHSRVSQGWVMWATTQGTMALHIHVRLCTCTHTHKCEQPALRRSWAGTCAWGGVVQIQDFCLKFHLPVGIRTACEIKNFLGQTRTFGYPTPIFHQLY